MLNPKFCTLKVEIQGLVKTSFAYKCAKGLLKSNFVQNTCINDFNG